jgi:hypothetical protein
MMLIYFLALCANFGLGLYCGLKYKEKLASLLDQVW